MIQAYLSVWRSSGTVQAQQQQHVDSKLSKHLEEVVYPWPEISASPTPEHSDGRFAKAFPLTFPTGYGDLYQERIRNDFSIEGLAQHVFRHYDGRALRALRGHRVIWAIFNTVLRKAAQKKGALLHTQSHATALTKQELLELYATRDDLVQKLSSYGADIPTTSMYWKRTGNQLEWIVRQMSWAAPWTSTGQDLARQNDSFHIKQLKRKQGTQSQHTGAAATQSEAAQTQHRQTSAGNDDAASIDVDPNMSTSSVCSEHFQSDNESTADTDSAVASSDDASLQSVRKDDASHMQTPKSGTRHARHRESASEDLSTTTADPQKLWSALHDHTVQDHHGYDRIPAFWFTLNFPFNYSFDLHRFCDAVSELTSLHYTPSQRQPQFWRSTFPDIGDR